MIPANVRTISLKILEVWNFEAIYFLTKSSNFGTLKSPSIEVWEPKLSDAKESVMEWYLLNNNTSNIKKSKIIN